MKSIALAMATALALQAQAPLPKGQMPDLGRPTKPGDELPAFNADEYFPGKWTFEWDVPEGPLGPAGRIEGTTIYKAVDARFFDVTTDAKGPSGAFKIHELFAYHKEQKAVSRYVTDSRGFSFLQIGTIGGDLGGFYNIYLEGSPFTHNGHSIRMKHAIRLLSPLNYKMGVTVSVAGGPFKNYGNPWWRKDPTASW
jgi:hypothetical protein